MNFTSDQLPAIAQRIIDSHDADPYRMAWARWIIDHSGTASDDRARMAQELESRLQASMNGHD
jgi:hypothetical protein